MSDITPATLARLTDQLQAHSRGWLEPNTVLGIPPQQILRKWSLMLRYSVTTRHADRGAMLVKITRHQGGTIEEAIADKSLVVRTKREYEMLCSVERIFSNNVSGHIFCYIRPLAVLEEWNALITEELNCKPLKDYLLTFPMLLGLSRPWSTFEMLLERSARWLQIYHQGMGVQDIGTIQQIGLYEKFEEYFAQISDVLTGSEIKDIRRTIDSTFELASNLPVLMAVLHGDFHCSNLLVTPDLRIGSLDAECMRGPIYEDIAKLLADLETRSLQLYTFGLLIPQHRMERIWATVLNGYFGSIPPNHLLLNLFTVLAILYKWKIDEDLLLHSTGIQQMIRKILSPIRRQAMRVILKKHLDRLALQTSALPAIESVVTA